MPTPPRPRVRYRGSPLSRAAAHLPSKAPQPGDRFPWTHLAFDSARQPEDLFARLDDTRFNVLVVGQTPPAELERAAGDLLDVHPVPATPENERELARLGIAGPAFYLLRPDGHVGLAGTALTARAIEEWFGRIGIAFAAPASAAARPPARRGALDRGVRDLAATP